MKLSLNYIAGFFDGEGSIGIYTRDIPQRGTKCTSLRTTVANTNLVPLLEIQRQFGGYITRRVVNGNKSIYILTWRFHDAILFLRAIAKELVIKKTQAELAIEFWEWQHSPVETRCYQHGREGRGRRWCRTPETLAKEQWFVDQMKSLKAASTDQLWHDSPISQRKRRVRSCT